MRASIYRAGDIVEVHVNGAWHRAVVTRVSTAPEPEEVATRYCGQKGGPVKIFPEQQGQIHRIGRWGSTIADEFWKQDTMLGADADLQPRATAPRRLQDLKAALSSRVKPDITHVRYPFLVYTARPCEYGNDKYERANYQRPVSPEGSNGPTAADVERFRQYLRAAASHIYQVLDSIERHQSQDPKFEDVEGFKRAAYAVDTDATPGAKVGASMLPHVAPACSSLNMAITQAVQCGLLPADPGTPWIAETSS